MNACIRVRKHFHAGLTPGLQISNFIFLYVYMHACI